MRDYLKIVKKIYFKQFGVKKFREDVFMREIEAAMYYGQVLVLQNLIVQFAENPDMTAAECMGEAQLKLMESYSAVRKKLGLRIDEINLDTVMPREVKNDL